jgi:hypothetical protein
MTGWGSGRWHASGGFTGVDVVIVCAIAALTAAWGLPLAAHTLDVARTRHAAHYVASEVRHARARALATRRASAVVFDVVAGEWAMRTCRDGNGNGVRRAEIGTGVDPCDGPPVPLSARFRDVSIFVSDTLVGPDADPPSPDPVRFGASNMASCSSARGCSSGTVFVRSAAGAQYAVRVGGLTGRTRVLAYEPGATRWIAE